jgi:GAF domain-containing protein
VGAAQGGLPLAADAADRPVEFGELPATTLINVETQDGLRRLAAEQASLRRIATLVADKVAPEALFSAVSNEVARLFASDGAAIGRFEPDGPAVAVVGVSESLQRIPVGARIGLEASLASTQVYRTGRAARKDVSREDVHAPGVIGDALRGLEAYATVAAPIVVAGRLWGTLITVSTSMSLPADTEERLERFGELVATAIANAESRNELADSERRARGLAEEQAALRRVATLVARGVDSDELFVAVCNEVASLFHGEVVTIGRFEPTEPPELTAIGVSDGMHDSLIGVRTPLVDWLASSGVYRTGQTARKDVTGEQISGAGVLPDFIRRLGFFSTVSTPIRLEGELWGVLTVSSSQASLPAGTETRVESFSELVATAIANAQSRKELASSVARARTLADEQAALRRIATEIAQGATPDRVFDMVREEASRVLAIPLSILMRYDPDGSATLLSTAGPLVGPVGTRFPMEGDTSAVGTVYRTGRAAVVDYSEGSAPTHGGISEAAKRESARWSAGVPIMVEGTLWGVLAFGAREGSPPPDLETRLEQFTELLATAISNAESRKELAASEARARELANEQAALRRLATLVAQGAPPHEVFDAVRNEVAEAFGVRYTVLWRYDPDGFATVMATALGHLGPVGRRWKIEGDTSVAARIRETGHAERVDPAAAGQRRGQVAEAVHRDGMRSGVGVPIIVEGEVWGAMIVGSKKAEPLPAGLEVGLARFTELLATAIANAESREEIAQLAGEQAALRRVATLVAQGAEPRHVFEAVADEVAGIIDIPVVGVHRYEADGTFTMLGIAGETKFTVGSRWPVEEDGIAGMILATGRPARKDDYSAMSGRLGKAIREDLMVSTVGVPIVVEGGIWGFMVAAAKPGRPIPADTEMRLARFTELVATAVSNATTRADLLTSRARVVSAADETRRRLERDLHDGIQQWLVALALKARKAATLAPMGESIGEELSGLADDLVAVTDELREISRGIHPAILSDAGLDDALEALARRSGIRVDLDVNFHGRFDPTLEATVYYVVAESITNAVKHAKASMVAVRGGLRNGVIELEINDDGLGGADPRRGTGMIGLQDRVDTLGGTISFASPAGAGTTIRVRLPAGRRDEQPAPAPGSG